MTFLLVFFSNVLTDVLSVWFILSVTKKRPIRAGLVSVCIVSLYALSIIYIIEDNINIIPACLGAFIGTYFTVGKTKKDNN